MFTEEQENSFLTKTGFLEWHQFDCGFKKRIGNEIELNGSKVMVVNTYPSPSGARLYNDRFVIDLMEDFCHSIKIGDKVAFVGNRFICRQCWGYSDEKYIYTSFQALPMDSKKSQAMHKNAEQMAELYRRDLMMDCD